MLIAIVPKTMMSSDMSTEKTLPKISFGSKPAKSTLAILKAASLPLLSPPGTRYRPRLAAPNHL